jgi:hypothetical protein
MICHHSLTGCGEPEEYLRAVLATLFKTKILEPSTSGELADDTVCTLNQTWKMKKTRMKIDLPIKKAIQVRVLIWFRRPSCRPSCRLVVLVRRSRVASLRATFALSPTHHPSSVLTWCVWCVLNT